jgi:hypothetical protein
LKKALSSSFSHRPGDEEKKKVLQLKKSRKRKFPSNGREGRKSSSQGKMQWKSFGC